MLPFLPEPNCLSVCLSAQPQRGAAGRPLQPGGEPSRHQHGADHDHSVLRLLAALHCLIGGGGPGPGAVHPSAARHHAHVLC